MSKLLFALKLLIHSKIRSIKYLKIIYNRNNVFLKGHTVELRIPTREDVAESNWFNWYNSDETTKYNQHGIYPITRDQEIKIVEGILNDKSNILLSIYEVKTSRLIGNIAYKILIILIEDAS